jgi:hypothetical protein
LPAPIYDLAVAALTLLFAFLVTQSDTRAIEQLARDGWQQARAAASAAGTPEALAPATQTLAMLDKLTATSKWPLQIAYARSLVAAAMAAAQDERAEMSLHLVHARDLSSRLETSIHPAEWPLPIDEAEGDLRFEVHEYSEALAAYERATTHTSRSSVWIGLARSAERLRKPELACNAYRRALLFTLKGAELDEARDYVARCR